jgi:hypothetical protein
VYNSNFDFINNIISNDTECISCISRSDGGREVSGGGVGESSHRHIDSARSTVQLHTAARLTSSASGLVRKNKNKLDCRDHVIFSCTEKHDKLFENCHNISRLDSFHGSNSNDISRLHVKKGSNSNSDMYNLDYFHIPDNTIACVGDDLYRGGDLHDMNYDIKKLRPGFSLDINLTFPT